LRISAAFLPPPPRLPPFLPVEFGHRCSEKDGFRVRFAHILPFSFPFPFPPLRLFFPFSFLYSYFGHLRVSKEFSTGLEGQLRGGPAISLPSFFPLLFLFFECLFFFSFSSSPRVRHGGSDSTPDAPRQTWLARSLFSFFSFSPLNVLFFLRDLDRTNRNGARQFWSRLFSFPIFPVLVLIQSGQGGERERTPFITRPLFSPFPFFFLS